MHDLVEGEANRVVSRLHARGIAARKVPQSDGRWAIEVTRERLAVALEVLDSHRLLANKEAVARATTKAGFVPSREEQWFRYERAVATSIEDSVSAIQGVLDAKVHVNLPEVDPLFGVRHDDRGSGSVLLLVDERFLVKSEEVGALVAGAAGLPVSAVTILINVARADGLEEARVRGSSQAPSAPLPVDGSQSQPDSEMWWMEHMRYLGIGFFVFLAASTWVLGRRRKRRVKFVLPASIDTEA